MSALVILALFLLIPLAFAGIAYWFTYIGRTLTGDTDELYWPDWVAFGRVVAVVLAILGAVAFFAVWIAGIAAGEVTAWSLLVLIGSPIYAAVKVTEWAHAKAVQRSKEMR